MDSPAGPETYKAVVAGLPTPRLIVGMEGEAPGVTAARAALGTAGQSGGPSLYVREPSGPGEAVDLHLLARRGSYLIALPGEDRPRCEAIEGYTPEQAELAIRRLEHIARWTSALRLENPASGIKAADVELTILRGGEPLNGSDIRLEYRQENGRWAKPEIVIKIKNNSTRELFFALLGLSEDYEITAAFFPTGCVRLKPGQEVFAREGKPIRPQVPTELWKQGIIEFRDVLKLVVCTDEFDAKLMEQPPLAMPSPNQSAIDGASHRGLGTRETSLTRLLRQVQTRSFSFDDETDLGDWRTSQVAFTTVRPQESVAVPGAGRSVIVSPGVEVEGHAGLEGASVRLSSVPASSSRRVWTAPPRAAHPGKQSLHAI